MKRKHTGVHSPRVPFKGTGSEGFIEMHTSLRDFDLARAGGLQCGAPAETVYNAKARKRFRQAGQT